MSLRQPRSDEAQLIADWHPISVDEVLGWWKVEDVTPWVMVDQADRPIAYGEIWVEEDEDEVELARLIVPPALRGRGLGKRLVHALSAKAAATGMATTFLRVMPDNNIAIGCYRACGFTELGPAEAALWNEGQKRDWVWMTAPPYRAD